MSSASILPPKLQQYANASDVSVASLMRISVPQYHKMLREGILTANDSIELLEGLLVNKMSINPPHWIVSESLREYLLSLMIPGCFIHGQSPFTTKDSEPEPDVAIVHGTRRKFAKENPKPADMALVVEVSDSSLRMDRGLKKRIYARAKVPLYWIVNLVDLRIEEYSDPSGPKKTPDYRSCRIYGPKEKIKVVVAGKEYGEFQLKKFLDEAELS